MLCILVRFSPLFPTPSRFSLPTQLHFFPLSTKQANKNKKWKSKQTNETYSHKKNCQNRTKAKRESMESALCSKYSWAWGLSQSVIDVLSDTLLKKTNFCLSQQVSITNNLLSRDEAFSVWAFVWFATVHGLCMLSVSLSSFMSQSCCV